MKKNFAILITGHLRTFETNIKYLKKIFKNFDVYVYTLDTREHFKILRSLAIKNFELVNDSQTVRLRRGDGTVVQVTL